MEDYTCNIVVKESCSILKYNAQIDMFVQTTTKYQTSFGQLHAPCFVHALCTLLVPQL